MTVTCECGKRMQVADALAGKTVRCSACGESVYVAVPAAVRAAAAPSKKAESAGVYISPALIVGVVSVAMLIIGGVVFYFGPVKVSRQWDAMDLKARGTVMNLVTYSQKAYLSQKGEYDPLVRPPTIERDGVMFQKPFFSITMPTKVWFGGTGTAGAFTGYYNTDTGEVEGDVEAGAHIIAGQAVMKGATATMHIMGHEEPGKDPVVTGDGKPLKIIPVWVPERPHRR